MRKITPKGEGQTFTTDTQIKAMPKNLKKMRDAKSTGLYIIQKGNSKTWEQRLTINGKMRFPSLGSYPALSIVKARQISAEWRAAVAEGRDPIAERDAAREEAREEVKKANTPTFEEAARMVHPIATHEWKNENDKRTWIWRLEKYAFPIIGKKRVDEIKTNDIFEILKPVQIDTEKKETTRKLRQSMSRVFRWCIANDDIPLEANPVNLDKLNELLGKLKIKRKHHPSVAYEQLPKMLHDIESADVKSYYKLMLKMIALTGLRGAEIRGARWGEFDQERRTWVIPPERMKKDREHRVSLTDTLLDILDQAEVFRNGSDLLFPSPHGGEFTNRYPMNVIKRIGWREITDVHGLRSTFVSWARKAGFHKEHIKAQISHAEDEDETTAAYFRPEDYLEERRAMMQEWDDYLNEQAKMLK